MLLAVVLAPALAAAQATGEVIFSPDELLNATECAEADATQIELSWTVTLNSGVTAVPSGATFQVYASTAAATGTTCADATGSQTVGTAIDTTTDSAVNQSFGSASFATAVSATCTDTTQDDESIFVCVQLFDASTTPVAIGIATGVLTLSTQKPGAPEGVWVESGDAALTVHWDVPSTGHEVATYQVEATADAADDPNSPHISPTLSSSTLFYRLPDLVNGVQYSVVVYAYTESGTKSDPSTTVSDDDTIPLPVADFFDFYTDQGGREQGGCGTGAGALSLLGAAATLLAVRRRK
jgi:hypothetical protein